ncbi:MAG: T9SS type A sorting domain-containing protein [Bacteroidaceae bacterium]|nr:T9SS type A sorting domain-containing protein [Bacteroidaceae bacterium]
MVVITPTAEEVTIYNMSGMVIDSRIVEGRVAIEKQSGLYIVKVGTLVYKVRL